MKTEKWKKIPGFIHYKASTLGRIKNSETGRIKKLTIRKRKRDRYLVVNLCELGKCKNYCVHALVARAFMGARPEGKEVNHKDRNKQNPVLKNLEYVTHAENQIHALAKLDWCKVEIIRLLNKRGIRSRRLAEKFNISYPTIRSVVNNTSWRDK